MNHILIVEDEAGLRFILTRLLQLEGFQVSVAENGLRGLEAARALRPEVILCDILMPQMDGYAVLAALRADPATIGIPVIVTTASADPQERRACMERGARGYVAKPFNLQQVLAAIRACCSS